MPNIPQLQIRQTYAKIGIQTTPAKLNIQQPKASMKIHQKPIKVEINSTNPELNIDMTRAWSGLGKRTQSELTNTIYNQTKQMVVNGVAKIARDGDRLAAIHQQVNPIPSIAAQDLFEMPPIQIEGEAGYDNVDIRVQPGNLNIQWSGRTVNIDIQPQKPIINNQQGKVETYLRQKNSIQITLPNIDRGI